MRPIILALLALALGVIVSGPVTASEPETSPIETPTPLVSPIETPMPTAITLKSFTARSK